MKPDFRIPWRASLAFALLFTSVSGGMSLVATGSASFLGKDVTTIASSVVGFYPWIAVRELLRVAVVAFVVTGGLAMPFAAVARSVKPRWRRVVFPLLPILAYAAWWVGNVVEYPALFEPGLPRWTGAWIVATSNVVSPAFFYGLALSTLIVPSALGMRRLKVRVCSPREMVSAALGAAIVAATAALSSVPKLSAADPRRPNVLLIAVDSLRSDRLGRPDVTPHLTALLDDPAAVEFADHYVGVPRTFPSWVEMLQGRYAAKTGVRHMFPGFGARPEDPVGLAAKLSEAGYRTRVMSDFAGDVFPRFEAGFGEITAPKLTLMTMIQMSVDQMFPAFMPLMTTAPLRALFPALKQSPVFADPGHLGAQVRSALDSKGPWMTTVFFSTAHFPYAAPYPYYRMFAQKDYEGEFLFQKNPESSIAAGSLGEADVAQVRALYDGAVRAVDDELGRIFAEIKRKGLWESTVVVVTADHGEDLYEQGLLQGHGEHLRGVNVLKVPFIVKLAGAARPTTRKVVKTTRSIDVASTVVAATGLDARVGDGFNVLPIAFGETSELPDLKAYAETGIWFARGGGGFFQDRRLDYPGIAGLLSFDQGYTGEVVLNPVFERTIVGAKHRMWISGDYKMIYMPTPRGVEYELYDRRYDPENRRNLAAVEPARLAELKNDLLAFIAAQEPNGTRLVEDFVVPP